MTEIDILLDKYLKTHPKKKPPLKEEEKGISKPER